MRQRIPTTVLTYAILALVGAVSFMLPEVITVPTIHAQAPPEQMILVGSVRDFRAAHADFDVTLANGWGHVADNVAVDLGPDDHPVLNTGSDENGPLNNRVAHWKFDDSGGAVARDENELNDGTLQNNPTWTTGREGGALYFDGTDDYVDVPSSPQMQITGDITFAGWFRLDSAFNDVSPNTMVIMEKFLDTNHNFHIALAGLDYNRSEVPKGSLVFKVENGPTSDYYCYVWTNRQVWDAGHWYHFACTLTSTDTAGNKIYIDDADDTDSTIAAGVGFLDTNYDAPMRIGGKTIDYNGVATDIYFKGKIDDVIVFDRALTPGDFASTPGGYVVQTEWLDSSNRIIAPHLYTPSTSGETDACGVALADVAGVAGVASDGGIYSSETFDEWFHDELGVNVSKMYIITLYRVGSVYEFSSGDFHPIDDMSFGNEGEAHNENFTYTIHATFTYDQCTDQFIEFSGGDGAWLFIGGTLVGDLGGVDSDTSQYVQLDRLPLLVDGETFDLHFFYSERNPANANLLLRTNIELTATPATITLAFD